MSWQSPPDRTRMGQLLGKLSRQTFAEDGIFLSAMVVKKGTTVPAGGFYDLAEELDAARYNLAVDNQSYGALEVDRVFSHYM